MRFNFYPLYLAASGGGHLIENNKAAFNNKYALAFSAFCKAYTGMTIFQERICSSF